MISTPSKSDCHHEPSQFTLLKKKKKFHGLLFMTLEVTIVWQMKLQLSFVSLIKCSYMESHQSCSLPWACFLPKSELVHFYRSVQETLLSLFKMFCTINFCWSKGQESWSILRWDFLHRAASLNSVNSSFAVTSLFGFFFPYGPCKSLSGVSR